MNSLVSFASFLALSLVVALTVPASAGADFEGADGYDGPTGYGFDVSHDGYQQQTRAPATPDATNYVVIEAEDGTSEVVDGETVIVVQEPEPLAATEQAPPAPKTVVVVQPEVQCPGAIWVEGYWAYGNGEYTWVDGHCVVERVNYVFVQPRWDFYSNVWWYVPGYYRPWGVYVGFGYYRPWHWYPPYYHSYYRTRRPVAVSRGVPYRPTTARARPPAARSSRGIVRPTGSVGRTRTTPTRTQAVTRPPNARPGSVTRARPSATRVRSVNAARTTPARTTVVHRPPSSAPARRAVGRSGGPTPTSAVPRPSANSARASQPPRVSPSRTNTVVRRPASTPQRAVTNRPASSRPRPSASPSRTNSVQRTRPNSSRGGAVSRPGSGWSRPSSSGWSRPGGGYGRSASGGSGRARSR